MLLPIKTLLAMSSADQRRTHEDRERAEVSLLCKLQSKFCLVLWLSVDLGIVCDACLRLFDKKGHDIAKSASEISNFKHVIKTLFIDGYIFYNQEVSTVTTNLPAIGGYLGKDGVRPEFVTHCVERQLVAGASSSVDLRYVSSGGSASPMMLKKSRGDCETLRRL